ncbi:MAG: MFS transporter [Solirubrobacterales bacterium]|nr:MFS transporter [Solirubrobacterales bacterium]
MREGPWTGRYPAAAAMVIFALVPYLALSAALQPITPIIARDLHMSLQALSLTSGMANAAYAVGTVLAVLLAQHLPQRRMLVLYAALLVLGSVLAAAAPDAGFFIVGHVLQGLCTSLLLIAAVPPLVVAFSISKLRYTAMILNVCIFGAVALGPLVGGIQAQANEWRPLFWIIAGIAAAALLLSLLTFQDAPPADPSATRNPLPVGLAAVGCVALFYGSSELLTHSFLDPVTLVPLVGGLALIVVLLVYQYHARRPLLCIRPLGSTLPVSGIVVAMCAAASSISAATLAAVLLRDKFTPVHLGLLQFPEFIAALITAGLLGLVFRTRGLHYLVLGGMLSLIAGILVLKSQLPPTSLGMALGSGLVGFGVGGSVAPALFIAGFSLRNNALQRVFAIIELLRAVAAFMVGPVLAHVAATVGGSPAAGTQTALWICFGIATGGTLCAVSLYALGGVRPPAPSVEVWMSGEAPAWYSPPLLDRIRDSSGARVRTEPLACDAGGQYGGPRDHDSGASVADRAADAVT